VFHEASQGRPEFSSGTMPGGTPGGGLVLAALRCSVRVDPPRPEFSSGSSHGARPAVGTLPRDTRVFPPKRPV